jgi:RNA polymerase sigma factor (sigma-70 family)
VTNDINGRDANEAGFTPDFATWQEAVPYGVACVKHRKRRLPQHALVMDDEVHSIVMSALWEGAQRGKLMTRAYVRTRAIGAFIDEVRKLSVGSRRSGFLSRKLQCEVEDCLHLAELSVPASQEGNEEQQEKVELVERALECLDRRDRTIVEQVYLRDRSFVDVADDLHCSQARISQLHSRALQRIRDRVEALGHPVPPPPPKVVHPKLTPEGVAQRRQRVLALYRSDAKLEEIAKLERTSLTTVKDVLRRAGVELLRRRRGKPAAPVPWHLRPQALELHREHGLSATAVARQLRLKRHAVRLLLGADYVPTPYALRYRGETAAVPAPVVAEPVEAEAAYEAGEAVETGAEASVEVASATLAVEPVEPVAEEPVTQVISKPVDLGAARIAATFKRIDDALATVRRLVNAELSASRPRAPLACVASQGARICVGAAPPVMTNPPHLYLVPCTSAELANAAPSSPPGACCETLPDLNLPRALERLEDELIGKALRRAEGNKAAAAELLGLNRTTFVEMLKRKPRWKNAVCEPTSKRQAPAAAPAPAPTPVAAAEPSAPPALGAVPREEIIRLRADGWHPGSIAAHLQINYWVVRKVLDTPQPVATA